MPGRAPPLPRTQGRGDRASGREKFHHLRQDLLPVISVEGEGELGGQAEFAPGAAVLNGERQVTIAQHLRRPAVVGLAARRPLDAVDHLQHARRTHGLGAACASGAAVTGAPAHICHVQSTAGRLTPAVLDQIRMLTGLEYQGHKLLQVVLCGQPGLLQTIKADGLLARSGDLLKGTGR